MKKSTKLIITLILITIQAAFIALTIKAAVGLAAWDAVSKTFNFLTNIKVGTILIIMNSSLVIFQAIILKKDFGLGHLTQIPVSFLIGILINFFYYDVYSFEFSSYLGRLVTFIVSNSATAIILGGILTLGLVNFPVEGFCQAISNKYAVSFVKVRQGLDVVCIAFSLLVSLFTGMPLVVREGTIIGAILFSPILGISMERARSTLLGLALIE